MASRGGFICIYVLIYIPSRVCRILEVRLVLFLQRVRDGYSSRLCVCVCLCVSRLDTVTHFCSVPTAQVGLLVLQPGKEEVWGAIGRGTRSQFNLKGFGPTPLLHALNDTGLFAACTCNSSVETLP